MISKFVAFFFFILTLCSLTLEAKQKYDTELMKGINKTLSLFNSSDKCSCLPDKTDPDRFLSCSPEETRALKDYLFQSRGQIESWLTSLKEYETKGVIQPDNKVRPGPRKAGRTKKVSKLKAPYKMLACMFSKLDKVKIQCKSPAKTCKEPTVLAAVEGFDDTVHLCQERIWGLANPKSRLGAIIHEVAHLCFANDAKYFGWNDPPRNHGLWNWSSIADTYNYWTVHGICIPGYDCPEKINLNNLGETEECVDCS